MNSFGKPIECGNLLGRNAKMLQKKTQKGFSLVEIVIVICVIAILAAIAIPTFIHTRDNAKLSELKNQLNDSYTKFANAQIGDGHRVDPMGSYRFVLADGITGDGAEYALVNPTAVYAWDGESNDVDAQDFMQLDSSDYLYPIKYGQFYVVRRGTR